MLHGVKLVWEKLECINLALRSTKITEMRHRKEKEKYLVDVSASGYGYVDILFLPKKSICYYFAITHVGIPKRTEEQKIYMPRTLGMSCRS
jgi:hypothetical protein